MAISVITYEYFKGNLTIAQVTEASVTNNLAWFIIKHSVEFMRLLLGDVLYEAFEAGMVPSPAAKWTTLNGKIFDSVNKISPVANYVYWYYQRHIATETSGKGEIVVKVEHTVPVSSAVKVKLAWNEMVKMNKKILTFIEANPADYPEYTKPVWVRYPEEARQLYLDRMNLVKTVPLFF